MTNTTSKIGLTTATIIGMNAMIGAGIFTVPAALQWQAGPAGILTFAFVILAVWCMALSLARVAQLYPGEGSFYNYTKQWGGHYLGLLASGAYIIGLTVALGLLTKIVGGYIHDIIPAMGSTLWGVIMLIIIVLLNLRGVMLLQFLQYVLIACKILPLILITILCATKASSAHLFPFMPNGIMPVLLATKTVVFGFFGFEAAASLYNVVKNPEQNVPRAISYSTALVGIIYFLFTLAIIMAVPRTMVTSASQPLSELLLQLFPEYGWLVMLTAIAIICAILGTLHAMIWATSSLVISFTKAIAPQYTASQTIAVLIIGTGTLLCDLFLHNIDLFFSLTALGVVFAYTTSMLTLLIKHKEKPREKIITITGLLAAGIIFVCAIDGIIKSL